MTPDEAAMTAEYFLRYYVEGAKSVGWSPYGNDYLDWEGIFLRYPALCGPAPDYTVLDASECDEHSFASGEGPETCDQPYVYVDRCPVARVRVQRAGSKLDVSFDCIVDFPTNAFPKGLQNSATQLTGRRIHLPCAMGEPQRAVTECLCRLGDYLGTDINLIEIEYDLIMMRYEDYSATLT